MSILPFNGPNAPSFTEILIEMENMGFKMLEIVGYSEATIQSNGGKIFLQMDVLWARREYVDWSGVRWPEKEYIRTVEKRI